MYVIKTSHHPALEAIWRQVGSIMETDDQAEGPIMCKCKYCCVFAIANDCVYVLDHFVWRVKY